MSASADPSLASRALSAAACLWTSDSSRRGTLKPVLHARPAAKHWRPMDASDKSDRPDPYGLGAAVAEVAANTLLCLINQASFLLARQLRTLEQTFLAEGGFTERLYRQRRARRPPRPPDA